MDLFQFAAEGFEGGETLYFEVGEVLVEVFLVFCVVYFGVDPIVTHLPFVFEADFVELLSEEVIGIFQGNGVGSAGGMFLGFGFVSSHI